LTAAGGPIQVVVLAGLAWFVDHGEVDSGSAAGVAPRAVVIVAFPGVLGLDVVGPLEVFAIANRFDARPAYSTSVVSMGGGVMVTSSGLAIGTEPARTCSDPIDTLMVAGGYSVGEAAGDRDLVGWLRSVAGSVRRVTSVCSGAVLLARAGLLDGRRATTHWSACDVLATLYPSVDVDTDQIYVRDGNVWTSAGVTAGMDLALALVEHDHGSPRCVRGRSELESLWRREDGWRQRSSIATALHPRWAVTAGADTDWPGETGEGQQVGDPLRSPVGVSDRWTVARRRRSDGDESGVSPHPIQTGLVPASHRSAALEGPRVNGITACAAPQLSPRFGPPAEPPRAS
jgi:putative intracellular protease/amidase